jgi:hypothetical protein
LRLPQPGTQGNLTLGLGFPVQMSGLLNAIAPLGIVLLFWSLSRKRLVAVD